MPASKSTPNYQLPLYQDADKPSWRGDVNDTNTKIDAQLKSLNDRVTAPIDVDSSVSGLIANTDSKVNAAINTLLKSGQYVIVKTGGTGLTAKQLDELSL